MSFIDYYNVVADRYNSLQTTSDEVVRDYVSRIFKEYVRQGIVLDVGGGTGLDMKWMIAAGYKIYFLEPAANMRSIAKITSSSLDIHHQITFIENYTNIFSWSTENLPVHEKADGVLLNFAVLNSMTDVELFFEKISMVCKPGSYLFLNVINPDRKIILKKYGRLFLKTQFLKGRSVCTIHYKGFIHETYIYSLRYIKKRSADYFYFIGRQIPKGSDFMILIFSAK